MSYNECDFRKCGTGNQTCVDPNMTTTSLDDFICTCPIVAGNDAISQKGGPADCTLPPSSGGSLSTGVIVAIVVSVVVFLGILVFAYYTLQNRWSKSKGYETEPSGGLDEPLNGEHGGGHDPSGLFRVITVSRNDKDEKPGIVTDDDCNVTKVKKGSPFDRAGITKGMQILEINKRPVYSKKELAVAVKKKDFFDVKVSVQHTDDGVPSRINVGPPDDEPGGGGGPSGAPAASRQMQWDAGVDLGGSQLQAPGQGQGHAAFEALAQERDHLRQQLSALSARLHPESCTFCQGKDVWGLPDHSPPPDHFHVPPLTQTAAGCLPLEMVQDAWGPLAAEEQRLINVANEMEQRTPGGAAAGSPSPAGDSGDGDGGDPGGGGDASPGANMLLLSAPQKVSMPGLLSDQLTAFLEDTKSKRVSATPSL